MTCPKSMGKDAVFRIIAQKTRLPPGGLLFPGDDDETAVLHVVGTGHKGDELVAVGGGHAGVVERLVAEVRDGIVTHRTAGRPSTLEGKVVRLSDKIAYINHDIDDAIRARIFSEDYIPKEYTDVLGTTTKSRLNTLISDIIKCSIDKDDIIMSDTVHKAMTDLRQFMFDKLYTNPAAKSEEVKVCKLITELYNYYIDNIEELPDNYKRFIYERGEKPERVVCDYIAGMSDQYSISRFENIFVPKAWKG